METIACEAEGIVVKEESCSETDCVTALTLAELTLTAEEEHELYNGGGNLESK